MKMQTNRILTCNMTDTQLDLLEAIQEVIRKAYDVNDKEVIEVLTCIKNHHEEA